MKTFATEIYNTANPIGFEIEVGTIQSKLSILPWMEIIFGIAHVQKRTKSAGESLTTDQEGLRGTGRFDSYYPQGRKNNLDQDLSFDDHYASRAFFLAKDDININPKVDGWNWVELNILIEQPFSLIVHCSLTSLEIETYEQIKTDLLWALGQCPKVKGVAVYEDMSNVYKEFTITPELNGITRYPNYCVRIDAICSYLAFPYNGGLGYQPNY